MDPEEQYQSLAAWWLLDRNTFFHSNLSCMKQVWSILTWGLHQFWKNFKGKITYASDVPCSPLFPELGEMRHDTPGYCLLRRGRDVFKQLVHIQIHRKIAMHSADPEKAPELVMLVASPSAEKAPEPVMPVPSPSAEKAEPVASPSSSHSGSHMLSDENAAQMWKCLENMAILETAATCRHVIYV